MVGHENIELTLAVGLSLALHGATLTTLCRRINSFNDGKIATAHLTWCAGWLASQ
jgi:hypothetical protein